MQGRDSEGVDMPPYSTRYQKGNVFYRRYKMQSNPLNRGRWDLKHWWNKQYDGQFYRSIKAKVTLKQVVFDTNYNPTYMRDIYHYKAKRKIIGITKKQFINVQQRNINKVKPKLLNIINKGS